MSAPDDPMSQPVPAPAVEPAAEPSPAPVVPEVAAPSFSDRYRLLLVIAAISVILDQAVKRWVVHYFGNIEGRTHPVLPGTFDLILTRNPGAAWGMLGDLRPDALRIAVFVLISIGAVTMVLWLARRAKPTQRLLLVALALVLGGALGNLVDRIFAGRVVDFLDFYSRADWMMSLADRVGRPCDALIGCHWPAFNVADICISTGVGLLILDGFLTRPRVPQD